MSVIKRSDYWNDGTSSPFTTATGQGQSWTDLEDYLFPVGRAGQAALHGPGVAHGLSVRATIGGSTATIAQGVAFDAAGRTIVLAAGGLAVTDPEADPDQMPSVQPVVVPPSGLLEVDLTVPAGALPAAGPAAVLLTLAWRELDDGAGQLPHAPWLRLVPRAGFAADGTQVVLAALTLSQASAAVPPAVVSDLTAGFPAAGAASAVGRTLLSLPASRLELWRPRTTSGTSDLVDDVAAAELAARDDGGLDIRLAGASEPVLSIDGSTGDVAFFTSLALRDRFSVDASGAVSTVSGVVAAALSVGTTAPQRVMHVEGTEVHSGGGGGGFSFSDRNAGTFTELPGAGERWVWYAVDGEARLWSGFDRLSYHSSDLECGLQVDRRMRIRQGGSPSAGIWLNQDAVGDRGFMGMVDDSRMGFYGVGCGWAFTMNADDGSLEVGGPASLRAGARISGDAVVGAGGNGTLTTRHVNGKAGNGDGPDDLFLNWSNGRWVHVGGQADSGLEVVGGTIVRRELSVGGNTSIGGSVSVGGNGSVGGSFSALGGTFTFGLKQQPNRQVPMLSIGGGTIASWSGGGLSTLDVFASGALYVGGPESPKISMYADGTLRAVNKRFSIDHPLDPEGKMLEHAAIEGPEVAVYYRGEARLVGGRVRVELPGYFEALTRSEGRTVQLTPIWEPESSSPGGLAASRVVDGCFEVVGDSSDQAFCWQVTAVRADVEPLQVEIPKREFAAAFATAGAQS